jgi:uncharacterized protein (TIGR00297 family)
MFVDHSDIPLFALLVSGVCYSIYRKKLTPFAALTGVVCGLLIYIGAGYTGVLMLTAFFLMGSLATGFGRNVKQYLEKQEDAVTRKYTQVLANAGCAAIFALCSVIYPAHIEIYRLLLAASIASATADTLSSELGMLYGKNFYNCLTWKKEAKGPDGVISLEGTAAGMLGASLIALINAVGFGWNKNSLYIILSAMVGNLSDSILGASFERKGWLNNDAVNFLSTLIAAFFCLLISKL